MSEPQRERMNYELLEALRREDERFVRKFFSQDTESSNGITSELPEDAENVTDRARICQSWRGVTAGGNSALHIVAGCGHVELAKFICDKDSSLLTVRNAAGETPLHCAARAGAGRIASHFISVAEDSHRLEEVLLAKDRGGKTALYMAAEEGHAAAARELMSALPVLATEDDKEGVSPLYVAVLSGSLEVVQILIESPWNGQTALHAAAKIDNPGS
uniref:Uncharacterized protein n=1 Tax=Ananas comosus var. bracteatus TaxID=296719 RepID=A0A6V7PJL5_ANACO|nr:unnamed protein product [Ananas comosus var. bracteatus]